jgi:ComF family protein
MSANLPSSALSLLRICAEMVFPRICNCCNDPLPSGSALACPACRKALLYVDEWDEAFRHALGRLTEGGSVSEFVVVWYFEREGTLRTLMHRLKYGGATAIGEEFGRELGERILGAGLGGSDMVVPLPLHASRRRERGFNQCEYIARGVSSVTGCPVRSGLLRRIRFTPSQTSLGSLERRDNVRGAFALRGRGSRAVKGKTILLVDDVVTTGATMRSCAETLREAGARAVVACAVALAR